MKNRAKQRSTFYVLLHHLFIKININISIYEAVIAQPTANTEHHLYWTILIYHKHK